MLDLNARYYMAPFMSHIKTFISSKRLHSFTFPPKQLHVFMCLSLSVFSIPIDMLAVHPSTLHFKVQNKPEEVLGMSPKTTEHVHLSVPVELRIAGFCFECVHARVCERVYAVCMYKPFLSHYSNKMTNNRRSPYNSSNLKAQLFQQN